jgi:lipopolysaccharide transport system ATP-binding protein
MRKKEITRKLDEIIDFSGVERYIDTPVKRYSSGMYVRLAFAVAAYLESEILIVDEVLAVGDAEFQKKCLGKMGDITTKDGRTVLFVSHNLAAVKTLCSKGIVLENGNSKFLGSIEKCVSFYLEDSIPNRTKLDFFDSKYDNSVFKLNTLLIKKKGENFDDLLIENDSFEFITDIDFKVDGLFNITYHLYNELGEALFSIFDENDVAKITKGRNKIRFVIPSNFFQAGFFSLSLFIVKDKKEVLFLEKDIFSFTVVEAERKLGVYMGREPGYIKPKFEWSKI